MGNNRFLLRTFSQFLLTKSKNTFRQIWEVGSLTNWSGFPSLSYPNSTGLQALPSSPRGGFCYSALLTLTSFLEFHPQLFNMNFDYLDFINNILKTIFYLKYSPTLPRLGILIITLERISLSACS